MKKKLANLFLAWAKKLDPKEKIENVPTVEEYEPKKIGLCLGIGKKDIRKFKADEHVSEREAHRMMLLDAKKKIQSEIFAAIQSNNLIEYDVKKDGKEFSVTGEMKVYIKK